MYSLLTAILLKKNKPKSFEELDVSALSVKTLLNDYQMGYLVLSHNTLKGELFLSLDVIRATNLGINSYDVTIPMWLSLNGNKLLKHTTVEPTYNFYNTYYADVTQSGFQKMAVHPSSTIENYPISSKHDLYLKKGSVDSDYLDKNSVYVVNGYLHTHSRFKDGVKVSDGTKTILHSRCNQVGVLSFASAGGVNLVNFTTDMIKASRNDIRLYEECYLDLGIDLTGKTVLLSIAGQLIYGRDAYRVFDAKNGKVMLSLARINFIDRIQEALRWLVFEELKTDYSSYPMSIDTILADPFILSTLRMSQSFALIIDQENLLVSKEPVLYNGVLGRYYSHGYGYRPMLDEFGRLVPYFYQGKDKYPFMNVRYNFSVPHEYVERKFNIRDTTPWRYRPISAAESITNITRPMKMEWLDLQFITRA